MNARALSTRMSADERREAVIAAATIEFATGGLAGTATDVIARRAGVSQPYLFQLFGTKRDLFLAVVHDCFARTSRHFEAVARSAREAGLSPGEVLDLMGKSYVHLLLGDRNLLRLQLHAYAACNDPQVRIEVRQEFLGLWQTVARVSGTPAEDLVGWFASGMLINVIASIDDAESYEEFVALLHGGTGAMS